MAPPSSRTSSPFGFWQQSEGGDGNENRQDCTTAIMKKRRGIWQYVLESLPVGVASRDEREKLQLLVNGRHWMNNITPEHREIYQAIYREQKDRSSIDASRIEKDIHRTFNAIDMSWIRKLKHGLEQKERFAALNRILNAVSYVTGGYTQGMNFIAALLLLESSSPLQEGGEESAFILLAYILRQLHLDTLYEGQGIGLVSYAKEFDSMMIQHLPRLHYHFKQVGFTVLMFGVEWFNTIYGISCPRLLSLCAYDAFLVGIPDILLRLGIAMLAEIEEDLLLLDGEGLQMKFKRLVVKRSPHRVLLRAMCTPPSYDGQSLVRIRSAMDQGLLLDKETQLHDEQQQQQRQGKEKEEEVDQNQQQQQQQRQVDNEEEEADKTQSIGYNHQSSSESLLRGGKQDDERGVMVEKEGESKDGQQDQEVGHKQDLKVIGKGDDVAAAAAAAAAALASFIIDEKEEDATKEQARGHDHPPSSESSSGGGEQEDEKIVFTQEQEGLREEGKGEQAQTVGHRQDLKVTGKGDDVAAALASLIVDVKVNPHHVLW